MLAMKILSFDTSNNLASVAIMHNEELLSYSSTEQNSKQAEKLFQLIEQNLQQANLQLTDIDLVSLTNGPGSFTGVRIGLAAALGLQMGCKAQFIALTNFQVLAWQAKNRYANSPIAVLLDARREQVYLQQFNAELEALTEAKLIEVEELLAQLPANLELAFSGDGVKLLPASDPKWHVDESLNINVNAEILAKASLFYWQNKRYHDLIPLYIREPDVSKPKS